MTGDLAAAWHAQPIAGPTTRPRCAACSTSIPSLRSRSGRPRSRSQAVPRCASAFRSVPGIGRPASWRCSKAASRDRRSRSAPTWTRCRSTRRTDLPFASQIPGKMHACGHDAHTAIALGRRRRAVARCATTLAGRVMFIFQPAEETLSGAAAMLDDGAFDDGKPDAILGFHNWPQLATGHRGLASGRGAWRRRMRST